MSFGASKQIQKMWIEKYQKQKVVEQCYHQNVLYVVLKNQDFLKEQETKGILSCLGLETPLRKIP